MIYSCFAIYACVVFNIYFACNRDTLKLRSALIYSVHVNFIPFYFNTTDSSISCSRWRIRKAEMHIYLFTTIKSDLCFRCGDLHVAFLDRYFEILKTKWEAKNVCMLQIGAIYCSNIWGKWRRILIPKLDFVLFP